MSGQAGPQVVEQVDRSFSDSFNYQITDAVRTSIGCARADRALFSTPFRCNGHAHFRCHGERACVDYLWSLVSGVILTSLCLHRCCLLTASWACLTWPARSRQAAW